MFSDLKPYERYGTDPGQWIPAMPEHWRVVPGSGVLEPVAAKNTGLVESTVLSLSYGKVIVKPPEKLRGLVPESFETYQVLEPGDIVVRPTDLQNDKTSLRVGLVHDRGIITSAYLGLRTHGVGSKYAFAYLAALDHMKIFYGMGSGLRQNLDLKDFKRLPVPVPPANEQAAIVKYLAHAHARIDRAIAAKRKLIALLEEQKQAIIHTAVTHGLDPSVPRKYSGIPWLGEIPAYWEVRRLKDLCIKIVDCKNRTPEEVEGGQFTVVRTSCIRAGKFTIEGAFQTDKSRFEEWTARGAPRIGDVFFTREAPMGEAAMVPDRIDLCMGQRMMYLRPDSKVLDAPYLLHAIYGPVVRSYIATAGKGSTVGHLRLGQVANLPILVGPISEQVQISRHIAGLAAPIEAAQARGGEEIQLLREFRARLTSDVVTGQIDVREIAVALPELTDDVLASADNEFDDEDDLIESDRELLGSDE